MSEALNDLSISSGDGMLSENGCDASTLKKKPAARRRKTTNNAEPRRSSKNKRTRSTRSSSPSSSSRSSSSSSGSVKSLDLTIPHEELKPKYCPRGKRRGALSPPANWRGTEQKVREWYKLDKDKQKAERKKFNENLSRSQKEEHKRKVPGQSKKLQKKNQAPVSRRTRSAQDGREKPRSLPASQKRKEAASKNRNGNSKKGRKRNRNDQASSIKQQDDGAVRSLKAAALLSVAKLANALNSNSLPPGAPRQQVLLTIINEIPAHNQAGGKPKTNLQAREKTDIVFLGDGSSSHMRKNKVLKEIQHWQKEPQEYTCTFLMQEKGAESIVPGVQEYNKTLVASRPNTRVLSSAETSNNVPASVAVGTLQSPSKGVS